MSYFLVYEDFTKFFKLTVYENLVGSFILNTCINIYKGGFCGFSNKTIAERLSISVPSVIRAIKGLKEKDILIIVNSGSAGRQIYPNYETLKTALSLSVNKAQDTEIEQLQKALKDLKCQLDQKDEELNTLKKELTEQEDPYSAALFSFNISFSDSQKRDIKLYVSPYYRDFHKVHSMDVLQAHFEYLASHIQPEKIYDITAYLLTSLKKWESDLQNSWEEKQKKKSARADGSTLSDWYKQTETTPAPPELLAKALAVQKELFGSDPEDEDEKRKHEEEEKMKSKTDWI